jgi:hypothetical protein
MGKALVRVCVILIAILFLFWYAVAQFKGVNLFSNFYILLLELIVVVYAFSEGKYHCKFLKYTAVGILVADTITRLDYALDFLNETAHNLIPAAILGGCIMLSVTKAIIHFLRVGKIKRIQNARKQFITNQENGPERLGPRKRTNY